MKTKNRIRLCLAIVVFWAGITAAEGIQIAKVPDKLPRNVGLGTYSPLVQFNYSGLATGQKYTLKVWLLSVGSWNCASSQWCERTYTLDNTIGNNPNGSVQIVDNCDIYDYEQFDWVVRLYNSAGQQVTWTEKYISATGNRPPVLSPIGSIASVVGQQIEFTASASDIEGQTITYGGNKLPQNALLDPTTGRFFWTPDAEGDYQVLISATDNGDGALYDSQIVYIHVGPKPEIQLNVPTCGSINDLTGKVTGLQNPTNYRAVVSIFVPGSGWWSKPYANAPLTPIRTDGSFTTDITTGGEDAMASMIHVTIVPASWTPVVLTGSDCLPDSLLAYPGTKVNRDPAECRRMIQWSGYTWWVKSSQGTIGPGPNVFSDSPDNVWVDADGDLHLKIKKVNNTWSCAEIVNTQSFGYGSYVFKIKQGIQGLDQNAVLGLFTWQDDCGYSHREIDIEFGRWASPANPNSQYVIQPWNQAGNITHFETPGDKPTLHRFYWTPSTIYFQSMNLEDGKLWPVAADILADWDYAGSYIPKPDNENVRLNLWLFNGKAPSNLQDQEVIIESFQYRCSDSVMGDVNHDCRVDLEDFQAMSENWLWTFSG